MSAEAGVFITFEGGDGAGKSTHIRFLAAALEGQGREALCLREPGGTVVGEALRDVVLDPANEGLAPEAELFIYEAARAQIVAEVIKPALARGAVVLCDRFCDSTVAYQAYGRGLSREFVQQANRFACQGVRPDRTVLMLASEDPAVGLARASRGSAPDRMEGAGLEFHERVAHAFRLLETHAPDRVRVVRSAARKSDTARAVFSAVADVLGWDAEDLPFDDAFFHGADRSNRAGKGRAAAAGKAL
ncbi:dTMP kinase [Curtanaerobium respiraculi]|uniref:dTMP kinase n=1 Tax=Curtanaerobium respiraculi TaxID=2949669 RepID=UPI0024B3C705|nr:dTMP kinase [Curtanaerobium respiraculi]